MITTIKWNSWRNASIAETSIADNLPNGTYFFSANAFGLKGKLPGAKHSWCSIKSNTGWVTMEVTDIETVEFQKANIISCTTYNKQTKQVVVSDRNPATLWFGNTPKLIYSSVLPENITGNKKYYPYILSSIKLYKSNCNTYFSYLLWVHNINLKLNYIGFKSYKHWNKIYNV